MRPTVKQLNNRLRPLWRSAVKHPLTRAQAGIERLRYNKLFHRILEAAQANQLLCQLLASDSPVFVARIGHTEGRIAGEWLWGGGRYGRLTRKEAHQYSGIFPVSSWLLDEFASLYVSSLQDVDVLGFWQSSYQARLVSSTCSASALVPLGSLEPYFHDRPWTGSLAGRRVIVVHPFARSILEQYQCRREILFANSGVLPPFDLRVHRPPQTLAPSTSGFTSWLEAFSTLKSEVLSQDFDVALLGCGAYGLPLGAAIKRSGRQVVQLGGALQILFGIRGRRWEAMPQFAALMHDGWIRPSPEETPASAGSVDGACYW